MMELIFGSLIYLASVVDCSDGDTCRVSLPNLPIFVREQRLRFADFDTPEMNGKCAKEKEMAKRARAMTEEYVTNGGKVFVAPKKSTRYERYDDSFGRLLVEAPALKKQLIEEGLARPYNYKDGRKSWCS